MQKFLLLLANFTIGVLNAQHVICTQSGSDKLNDVEIQWTLGELMVGEYKTNEILVTQGVQQPRIPITPLQTEGDIELLKIYPNPTSDIIFMKKDGKQVSLSYKLLTISGAFLQEGFLDSNQASINISKYNSGTYILQIHHPQKIQSYQIIKSK